MKIAIIGAGISGLVSAYYLHKEHEISVFEADDRIGGHTNTVDCEIEGQQYSIDTGFIVFNDRTYPNFIKLLNELGVASQPTIMSFSVSCERTGLEYRGADLKGLFAQRRNFFNSRFYRLLWDFIRFNKLATNLVEFDSNSNPTQTVGQFLRQHRFSNVFTEQYLFPMGAAVWSCPFEKFSQFPIEFIADFYYNHGLLSVANRPQWRVISGGSREYLEPLTRSFSERISTRRPVISVERSAKDVRVTDMNGVAESFDHVIFACHSDQALQILGNGANSSEQEILSAFPYEKNVATLHTQYDVLPRCRRAWASWNYFNPETRDDKATVTYNMNILQSLDCKPVFCVTLNDDGLIKDDNIVEQFVYHHPTFDVRRKEMQGRHSEVVNHNRTSFCGAYWGNGFHEDGVKSALTVVAALSAGNHDAFKRRPVEPDEVQA